MRWLGTAAVSHPIGATEPLLLTSQADEERRSHEHPAEPLLLVNGNGWRPPHPGCSGSNADGFSEETAPLHGGPAVETFRLLALSIEHLMATSSPWSIAVVSAFPDEGRRAVVSELVARSLSEVRPPVRLVACDPATVSADHEEVPHDRPYGRICLGGLLAPSPQALANDVRRTIDREMGHGHSIVIDAPPATSSSLAFAVADLASACIYVARPRGAASPVHGQVRYQLDLLGVRVLGVVVDEG